MADYQKRVQILRQQLDDSIKLYYCQQQQAAMDRINNSERSIEPVNVKNYRILHMLHQDEANACIQISGNMINKTAVVITKMPNNDSDVFEKVNSVVKSSVSPLQVTVISGNQQQHPAPEATINFMAGFNSPVGSIDSGMSSLGSSNSSPSSSPGCSPISVDCIPFQYVVEQQLLPRGRSTSESVSATVGLKSILKKSISTHTNTGRFLRSYSECQNREDGEMKVIVADMNNEDGAGYTPRKKRVSFSERLVQERSFRPNSSILSQKKKNQRKQKNKMKKKGALAVEDNSTDDETRHRSNSETIHCATCNNNEKDEMDPIECDLAACVLKDLSVVEQDKETNCHVATKIHKHILRINSD
ncbi:unnamed protein product [Cercopithifilaria johnstoni]|uniref:Uncharacterized protein n=1 Tax=Cercopithifilaria johnstoni TaxID=2874296 RepID=A0A8J2Q9H4_9BILA|nr:unnamed protein product [Cercopithifilaria johnstoni]